MTSAESPAVGTVANLPSKPENRPPFYKCSRSCTGQRAARMDTYLSSLTCLCTKTAGGNCFFLRVKTKCICFLCKSPGPDHRYGADVDGRRDKVIDCLGIGELMELNETILQGYILYKEQRPGSIGPWGGGCLATLKHSEHLCCFKFPFTSLP